MSTQFNVINATIRDLISALEEAKKGRIRRDSVLKLLDELENNVDALISSLAPEKITDERFTAASNALREFSEKMKQLRESVIAGKYTESIKLAVDIQETLRHVYRLLVLIRAGTPTPMILSFTPQFFREISVPEPVLFSSPMAAQIYNTLVRRGEATVEDLAMDLRVDDRTREEFNRALSWLISAGYVKPYFTRDNRMILRPAR